MYCSRCGTALPDDSDFCTSCGAKILKEVSIPEATETKPKIKFDGKKKTLAIVAVCIVFALGVWIIISQISKSNLHKELMRDWSRVESSGGSYYTLELDFSEDEIEYIFDSFFYDDTIATFDYKVISGNQIKIDARDTIYTIEFNDDKTMMTITPALTSADSSENWFHH